MTPIRIGLDIAKNVFQVHGVDDKGTIVIRKRLRRPDILRFFASLPPCMIGIEACSASHHWARELIRLGHEVRLMPARYVKPYVQRGKSDALDAEAICEAVGRPTMRFATIKTTEQQAVLTLHRARELLVKQQTMLANLIRGRLGEFGIVAPLGIRRVSELIAVINDDADTRILPEARIAMRAVADQLCDLQTRIKQIEQAIRAWHRSNQASRRLATIPGVGSITASAIVATVANATEFKSARHFAAFLGLTPKQCSTGGWQRLGRIWRCLHPPTFDTRRNLPGPLCARGRGIDLGQAAIGPAPDTNCDRCTCQQGGPRHLGASHARRGLSRAATAGRLIAISGKCHSERQGEGGDGPSVGPTTEANPLRGDAHQARNPNGSLGRRTIHQGQRPLAARTDAMRGKAGGKFIASAVSNSRGSVP